MPSPTGMTDEQLKAIGETAVAAAFLERVVEETVQGLLDVPADRVRVLLAQRGLRQKVQLARRLAYRVIPRDQAQRLAHLLGVATKHSRDRNALMHTSTWIMVPHLEYMSAVVTDVRDTGDRLRTEHFSTEELAALSGRIYRSAADLHNFMRQHRRGAAAARCAGDDDASSPR